MLFDQMCGIFERLGKPKLIEMMRTVALFDLQASPRDITTKAGADELAIAADHFFLPFPAVAIEDTATCSVLLDTVPEQRGLKGVRMFADYQPTLPKDSSVYDNPYSADEMRALLRQYQMPDTAGWLVVGTVSDVSLHPENDSFLVSGLIDYMLLADRHVPRVAMVPFDREMTEAYGHGMFGNVITTLREVMYINSPNRFVVEDMHVKQRRTAPGRIPRSDARPMYRMQTVTEIRKLLRVRDDDATGTGSGAKKTGHPRRRHEHTFRDARFKAAKGKTILIPAQWIGPREAVVKNRRYRVRVDL